MPKSATTKTEAAAPYQALADRLQEWTLAYRMRNPRAPYLQRDVAAAMDINSSTYSKIIRGRERPAPEQCLAIARFFGVRVDDVLRLAGYPDVKSLLEWVARDPRPHDPRPHSEIESEREYILDVLKISQRIQDRDDWKTSPFKDDAEDILASGREPWQKALKYANQVYYWGHSTERKRAVWERRTDDLLPVVS